MVKKSDLQGLPISLSVSLPPHKMQIRHMQISPASVSRYSAGRFGVDRYPDVFEPTEETLSY